MTLQELLERIRAEEEHYSPLQRQVADYVLKNYRQIPFASISELSRKIGVSHYTVVTFCNRLGFAKFSEFKKALSECASDLVIYNKISDHEGGSDAPGDYNYYLDQEISEGLQTIRATLTNETTRASFPRLMEMMDSARYIYIAGGRASSYFANLFAGFLRYLDLKVFELEASSGDYLDRISMIGKEDLVIAICFPRYTAQTVNSLALLHEKKIPIVLITDDGLSPAASYADIVLRCDLTSSSYMQCYSGCLALISAICRAVAVHRKDIASDHVHDLEKNLLDQGIFYKT